MDTFQWEEREHTTPLYTHVIAGSFAGISEHLSMIPIDNVKTHCQTTRSNTIKQIIKKIYKSGGFSNFYSGSSAIVTGCIPAHALYFSIYEKAKDMLDCRPEEDIWKFAFVGALSSIFHDLIMTPAETLKQRVQLFRSENSNVKINFVTKKILHEEGLKAFYRSFWVNYSMNIPFGSLIVLFNEKLKFIAGAKQSQQGFKYYLCGALAGGLASIPTTPLDVIKTKLNTQHCELSICNKSVACNILREEIEKLNQKGVGRKLKSNVQKARILGTLSMQSVEMISTVREKIQYQNVFDTVKRIWSQEGALGFFKGVQMRMMIQSVSSGIAWGTYQLIKGVISPSHYH